MRLWDVVLTERNEDTQSLIAQSVVTANQPKRIFADVMLLKMGDGFTLPVKYNSPAYLLESDAGNILLGYYDPSDKHNRTKTVIPEGDMYLTAGKSRAVRTSDDGSVQICSVFVKEDGTMVFNPLISFDAKNVLDVKIEQLIIDMFGANAGGNIAWSQDSTTGFNTFIENYKGSNKDIGPRVYHKIEGGPSGLTIQYVWDVTPGPVGGALPDLIPTALAQNIKVEMKGGSPFTFTYNLGPAAQLEISIDPTGALTIQNKINQAMIAIDTAGAVTAQGAAGLGKVEMSPAGKVSISGVTGVSIDGTAGLSLKGAGGQVLSEILANVIQNLMAHTHVTAMGPSGPPLPPAVVQLPIQLGLAKAFKGGA